ncbi:MAG: hypothetical protein U1E53_01275 [Dongiaceae bacterium]
MKELNNAGMVEVYNHPCGRTPASRIYDAFVDIWDRRSSGSPSTAPT